jgi:hypothetical protein
VAHTIMESRLNYSPEVAARVYELWLRKHSTFLPIPLFVLRYAQLLLALGDNMNLRALFTRAAAACEAQEEKDALADLWDIMLQFESELISGADRSSVAALQDVEKRKREALVRPDEEEIATGSIVGVGEAALIGVQRLRLQISLFDQRDMT